MKINLRLVKKVILITLSLLTVALLIGWFVQPTENTKIDYLASDKSPDFWINEDTNARISKDSIIKVKSGQTVHISCKLPGVILPGTCVGFYDPGFHFKMYVDYSFYYEGGSAECLTYGHETGGIWRRVPILRTDAGKMLTFELENPLNEEIQFAPKRVFICSMNDIPVLIAAESVWAYTVSTLYFILTAFLFMSAFFLYRSSYTSYSRIMLNLGFLTLCFCSWTFFDSNLPQLFFGNASIRYGMGLTSFCLIPIFMMNYFKEVLPSGKRHFELTLSAYEVLCIIAIILNFTGLVHILNVIYVTHVFLCFIFILVGYFGIIGGKHKNDLSHIGIVITFLAMGILTVFGLVRFFTSYRASISTYVSTGALFLFLAILITEGRQILHKYRESQKVKNYKEIAKIEPVTGGNSRIVGEEWLEKMRITSNYENMWLVHMNLNDFSSVNAMMGWNNGDKILKDIYEINRKHMKLNDIICSMGNSDFVFLLINNSNIDEFCINVTKRLNEYLVKNWKGLLLSADFAAINIIDDDNLDQLLDCVQFAYSSKLAEYNKISNCYYFTKKCREQAKHNLELETNVQYALEQEEFQMYLQPKINPETEDIQGAEALVRWSNHKIGLIPPVEFIPILEESGQVVDVDFYMFRKVCDYLVYRKENCLSDIIISVNVSKYGITKPDFFDAYKKLIDEMNVPAYNLEFEFTESMAFTDMEAIEKLIQQIHSTGAQVSMDDFGSAYSNIGAIGRLKFDVIKLDKQFFDNGFPENQQDYILVRGLINVFHDMHIRVVCEGIETEVQKRALKDLNADLIQGYFYAKPMLARDFTMWAKDHKQKK